MQTLQCNVSTNEHAVKPNVKMYLIIKNILQVMGIQKQIKYTPRRDVALQRLQSIGRNNQWKIYFILKIFHTMQTLQCNVSTTYNF